MTEFVEFPKMQRLYDSSKGVMITEKIDGTNAAIHIEGDRVTGVQSRKRLITPEDDNFGFARWVRENEDGLVEALGDGLHFGEWWGSGIQRGYGLEKGDKRFSLFNAYRWKTVEYVGEASYYVEPDEFEKVPGLGVVPILYAGSIEEKGLDDVVDYALTLLFSNGSWAAPGFDRPEGAVVFFLDSRTGMKVVPEGWSSDKSLTRG